MADVHLLGVYPVGPEEFLCALFHSEESSRFLPVWLPPVEGAQLLARLRGWQPTRPHAVDALADIARSSGADVDAIELSDVYEGVFRATLRLGDGSEIDLRPCDALAVASELDFSVTVSDDVLTAASVWMSAEDAAHYFDVEISRDAAEELEPADDVDTDAAFEAFLRQLGAGESPGEDGEQEV